MLVSDCCQGMGIGVQLLERVIDVARREKLEHLEAIMTADNHAMRHMLERQNFSFQPEENGLVKAELKL